MKIKLCAGLMLIGLMSVGSASAQVFFKENREFQINKACDAYTSFKKQTGATELVKDQAYTALGMNKFPSGTQVFALVDNQRKWVALECGQFADGETTAGHFKGNVANRPTSEHLFAPPTPPSVPGTQHCLPFFDDANNPVRVRVGGNADITPPAPEIEPFGHAVNQVCGQAGKVVSREEFKEMMRENPQVLKRLQAFTDNKVYADRPARDNAEDYLDDLADAWFNVKAFDHIMCGEPKAGGHIGGLHFHGRYLQLQESGEACRLANHGRNEVIPGVIYSMGVRMKALNGGTAKSPIKGYGLTLSAEEILKVVTKSFSQNPANGNRSQACLQPISDEEHSFMTVFVRRSSGIRTFYPDATPNPRDSTCRMPIRL